jgi:hypothetical protein
MAEIAESIDEFLGGFLTGSARALAGPAMVEGWLRGEPARGAATRGSETLRFSFGKRSERGDGAGLAHKLLAHVSGAHAEAGIAAENAPRTSLLGRGGAGGIAVVVCLLGCLRGLVLRGCGGHDTWDGGRRRARERRVHGEGAGGYPSRPRSGQRDWISTVDTTFGGTSRSVAPQRNARQDWVFLGTVDPQGECATTAPNRESAEGPKQGPTTSQEQGKAARAARSQSAARGPGEQKRDGRETRTSNLRRWRALAAGYWPRRGPAVFSRS